MVHDITNKNAVAKNSADSWDSSDSSDTPDSSAAMENPELDKLGTHDSAATDLQETIHTDHPVQINAPRTPGTGRYDMRTGNFDLKRNGEKK